MATQPDFVSILGNFRSLRNVDKNKKKTWRPQKDFKDFVGELYTVHESFVLLMTSTENKGAQGKKRLKVLSHM